MNHSVANVVSILMAASAVVAEANIAQALWREARDERGRRRRGAALGLAAALCMPCLAHAQPQQTEPAGPPQEPASPEVPAADAKSPYSLQVNLDVATAYFYRGIIQEDTGLIAQPAARLTINLHEVDGFKLDGVLGLWNSVHSQKTAARTHGEFSEYWYEADVLGGLVLTHGDFSLTGVYAFLTSPSDAFETVQELDLTLAYDDTRLFGPWALHPYVVLAIETGADASDGADSDAGTYLELGAGPGFSFDIEQTPVAITFPMSIGFSFHNYYQDGEGADDAFGFVQAGVKASFPLPLGDRYGQWSFNAGVYGLLLGDHTADYNGGDHEQILGIVGLQVAF